MDKLRNTVFGQPIMELIKTRYSVRTYDSKQLTNEIKNELKDYGSSIDGPFSPKVRIELINHSDIMEVSGGKIGTYGVIKGAEDYIAAIVDSGEKDLEQLGYVLEKFILFATSKKLGTCWLGGTFKKSDFLKLVTLKGNELFPIVSPIGYPKDKKSTIESFMRFAAGSNHRKPWIELFFNQNLNTQLTPEIANEYEQALEGVRLAPSASNKQPWRIVKVRNAYHFYLKPNKGYGDKLGYNIQRIDMGIAMCHFEIILEELGINGSWQIDNPELDTSTKEHLNYTVSWIET